MSTEGGGEPMDTEESGNTIKTSVESILEALLPISHKWYELGTALQVDSTLLHTLDKDFRNASSSEDKTKRLQRVLSAWAGREGVEMMELVNAVRTCDEEIADNLALNDIKPEELRSAEVKDDVEMSEQDENGGDEDGEHENQGNEDVGDENGRDNNEKKDEKSEEQKCPDIDTQKKELQAALKQQLVRGDIWYLVDIRWMKQWKKYVGYDTWDQSSAGKETANPGPLDNSNLFKDGNLREHLMDELDYFLVPESAWKKLSSWYGLSDGSKILCRKVVEYGLYMKHCKVEVYLLEFKICIHPDISIIRKKEFSRADTVADLEAAIRSEFEVPSTTECRVWHRYMTHTYELLSKADQSLQDAGLYNGQTIVLEKKKADGSWPRTTSTVSSTTHSTRSSDDSFSSSSTRSGSSYSSGYSSSWSYNNNKPSDPGLCGLSNLGNTCFMNSALQCLSNTAPLTEYFLGTEAGYKPYKKHINTDNPLGMGGAIAEAYGSLLDEIWSGKCCVTAPRHFKTSVGRYAPQFVGYAQHDSQELLAFLLDGLHEDLNLIKKKPYVDMSVATKDRVEKDIAQETWYKYLQRNQSVIVKLFQAQLRSTLVCPKCNEKSKTFDPFMFLSLPLPVKKTRTVCVYLVRTNPIEPVIKYKLKLPKRGCVGDLKKELGTLSGVPATHLAVVDVYNGRFHRIYTDRDSLTHIMEKDEIYCYQLENENVGNRKMVHVPVYMRTETERTYSYGHGSRYYSLFGVPTVAYVPAECTYRTLYTAIVSKMRRYVKLWSEVKDQSNEDMGEDDVNRDEGITIDNESSADPPSEDPPSEEMDVQEATNEENKNEESANNEKSEETASNEKKSEEATNDENKSGETANDEKKSKEAGNDEKKVEEGSKDFGERDLFKLVVVNSYGSQEIKKLVDDPKKPLTLSGSTYIACDWLVEVKEKCYDEDVAKNYIEHESCHENLNAKKKNIQLMDCFELFTVKETLGKDDEWYCPQCKNHVQASKKFDLWTLPDILVIHLKRFSYDRYWRDKLDVMVEFPVTGLDLSSLAQCPDILPSEYDLYAVSNHFGGMGGGHYTAFAKNKDNNKWYNFDDSHVSETTEDRLVTAAAYVLFYRRRDNPAQPTRSSRLDRSLSQSFAEEDKLLKEKFQEKKQSLNDSEFSEADEDNQGDSDGADALGPD